MRKHKTHPTTAKCRRYLVEREAAKSVVKVMEEITDDNMVRYVSVICLALLTLDSTRKFKLSPAKARINLIP